MERFTEFASNPNLLSEKRSTIHLQNTKMLHNAPKTLHQWSKTLQDAPKTLHTRENATKRYKTLQNAPQNAPGMVHFGERFLERFPRSWSIFGAFSERFGKTLRNATKTLQDRGKRYKTLHLLFSSVPNGC